MQSGYGGVSEIPPFMFAVSSSGEPSPAAPPPSDLPGAHPHFPPQRPSLMHHYAQFQTVPVTQQLFHHPHHHQFQLFQHLENPSPLVLQASDHVPRRQTENSVSPARLPAFLTAPMSFKMAMNMNDSGGGGGSLDINDDESQLHRWSQREEDSGIKEPSWRPLDIDYINTNNKRCNKDKELETSTSNHCNKTKDTPQPTNNFKVFSELEAIYKPGAGPIQAASGSALTADDTPIVHSILPAIANTNVPIQNDPHVGASTETSGGEEPPAKKASKGNSKRKRKRRREHLLSFAAFFESLVKQLIDHQEELHNKFLEVLDKRDQERSSREEAWRKQESAKSNGEAAARAREHALASSREDVIVSLLEKITGERINLPPKPQFSENFTNHGARDDETEVLLTETKEGQQGTNKAMTNNNTSRWPKAEVQALIQVRTRLESRFQEPGLKGPMWDEVSSTMASMGFQRSAKRCKEKWENINKYFRKTKESGKKRPEHSKTCPYFHQLDQLYSRPKTTNRHGLLPSPSSSSRDAANARNSELLDAILGKCRNEGVHVNVDNENEGNDNEDDDCSDGLEREQCEEENHEQQQQEQQNDDDDDVDDGDHDDDEKDDLHESALFFQRLQS